MGNKCIELFLCIVLVYIAERWSIHNTYIQKIVSSIFLVSIYGFEFFIYSSCVTYSFISML